MALRHVPAVHHEALETGLAAEGLPFTFVATVTFYLCRRMVWRRQREGHGPHPLQDPGAGFITERRGSAYNTMALVHCVWFSRGVGAPEALQAHRPTHNSGFWPISLNLRIPRVMAECSGY